MKFLRIFSLCALLAMPACAQTTNAPRLPSDGRITDADSLSFISRAGITNDYDKVRVNKLVVELKAANLWSKFDAIYPFAGVSSNSEAINLVSTNYTLTFHGTNLFTTNGFKPDGISGFADTHGQLANSDDWHLYASFSSDAFMGNPVIPASGYITLLGADDSSTWADLRAGTNAGTRFTIGTSVLTFTNTVFATNEFDGNALANFDSSDMSGIFNSQTNSILSSAVDGPPLANIFIGARINATSTNHYASSFFRAASFGKSLTPDQVTAYFGIMTRYAKYVPSQLFVKHPTSNSPLMPAAAISHPTTNAPRLP